MFIVFRIKWEERDICEIFLENLVKGRVYKKWVYTIYVQAVQSIVYWLESKRLPIAVLVQKYSGHSFLLINPNLYKEATNHMWKECYRP